MQEHMHTKWYQDSCNMREKLGASNQYKPWTSRSNFKGTGMSKTLRTLDILDIVFIEALRKEKKFLAAQRSLRRTYVDISQSHSRKVVTWQNGITPTVTTSTEMYSFGLDRVITPVEILRLHGHENPVIPKGMSYRDLKRLAGEGMAVPCIASVIWCIFLTRQFSA